ncbi:unnamed protein product [Fusarium venenatum]|uniref:Alcohol acetyltransferase n=1 Tax=Fusarium venenatum TaxID=56646 RepID=A0A2L2T9U8_9HYPO|nr:uncharacterized protein FVRRES_13679 [Fusarium venenatum]CEI41654.1 unnamed protein product [Fusarium venenatum]
MINNKYTSLASEDKASIPLEKFYFALELSLQATIRQHSALLYGISEKTEASIALFKQLDQIDRQDILRTFHSSNCISIDDEAESDTLLSRLLEDIHEEDWLVNKPAWQVIVLDHFPGNWDVLSTSPRRIDIAFFAHHSIADGLSGIAFHTSLGEKFERLSASLTKPTWPMTFNEPVAAPVTLEECIDCFSCSCTICTSGANDRKAWVGAQQTTDATFRSMVRIVNIPAEHLVATLQKCKKAGVTLTGYLHAVICTSLWHCIPDDIPGIRSITPFSARNHTKTSARDIVNHISYLTSYTSREELEMLQEFELGSEEEAGYIMELAKSFSNDVATKVGEFPHGCMATNLNRIPDLLSQYQNQGPADRRISYELSNLGLVSDVTPPKSGGLKLEKVVFSQCASSVTPTIGFNCVSKKGGSFVMSVTWAEGVIEESLVDQVTRELQGRFGPADDKK